MESVSHLECDPACAFLWHDKKNEDDEVLLCTLLNVFGSKFQEVEMRRCTWLGVITECHMMCVRELGLIPFFWGPSRILKMRLFSVSSYTRQF